jgi:chromosome segregation ATPase
MTDEALCNALRYEKWDEAADRIEALTAKVKLMDDLDVINGEKIEALTEQLEAARADAEEAEAYAEELGKEIELNEQEACMLEDDFIKADKEIDDLKAKLAKAVELLKEARQDLEEYVTHEWPKDEHPVYERKWERDMELCRRIDATLAEIEGEKT